MALIAFIPLQSGEGGALRHQGPGHHLRVGRGRRQDAQRGPGQVGLTKLFVF